MHSGRTDRIQKKCLCPYQQSCFSVFAESSTVAVLDAELQAPAPLWDNLRGRNQSLLSEPSMMFLDSYKIKAACLSRGHPPMWLTRYFCTHDLQVYCTHVDQWFLQSHHQKIHCHKSHDWLAALFILWCRSVLRKCPTFSASISGYQIWGRLQITEWTVEDFLAEWTPSILEIIKRLHVIPPLNSLGKTTYVAMVIYFSLWLVMMSSSEISQGKRS